MKALDLLLSETDFKVTEGDEITVPTATLSNQTEGVTVTVKVSGQYQEEKEVAQGEKLTAASGVTEIVFTAKNADGTFELSRTATVVAIGKDEIISFEKDGADNPDFNIPAYGQKMGNEELNDNPAYVKSGKYSAKLTFGPNRANQSTYAAGFCYWENQLKTVNVEGANGLSMWIYCEKKEAYIVASIATGAGAKYSGARISHVIKLAKGWNEVNINFDYQVYNAGEKTVNGNKVSLDIKNGISELCFYRVKKGAYTNWDSVNGGNVTDYIYDNALSVYLDEVRAKKLELPDGVYFTFDSKPASTGTINGKATVVAPRMLVTEGVTLTAKITAPDGTVTEAAIGDEFTLTQSGRYIITYKAEKEGKPSQEIEFEVLVPAVGEFLSFETVNGATPDIAGALGEVTINTDAQYVKSGSQSAKLTTVLNQWGNCVAGVCHYEETRHMPNIEGATGITFWLYSENALYLYAFIGTGSNNNKDYVSAQAKPIAVKAGWNFITIDFRYDMATSGADISKGICELYFGTGDTANGKGTTPATFYLDSVCFAALPERVVENLAIDFTNISLPADKEFGNVELCTDEQYTKNGKPSLMLEMTANEAENKNMRACYSSWGKGIMLTSGENAVKFEVYASRAGFVSFEFGTGGNAGSGAYGGVKFAKVIELQQGWNTVTITFDATGASGDVNGAVLADGIVHFGATAVKSLDSAVVGNDHYADVATEPLTLYVSTMYAIKA